MVSVKALGVRLYSQLRFGGVNTAISLGDRAVVSQSFNALGANRNADTAVVLLPAFTSIPNIVPPGVVGQVAREKGADFVRFFHPDLLDNAKNVTYDRMVQDATALINNLPHKKIVLAGSSFGAGMMPLVRNAVDAETPGKIVGMFGWMSVPPAALLDLFKKQDGWEDMQSGKSATLTVVSPTMPKPFIMSQRQLESVKASTQVPQAGKGVVMPFNGPALFFSGANDPVGKPEYTREMAYMQLGVTNYSHEVLECGHRIQPEQIARGLRKVLAQI